tara:strand:+ start:396 stop:1502 length:1107 start_codon:yes stop_codon:yes gene_type:complete
MLDKQKINYASSLAVHPLIAEHPLYKSILESDLDKFFFTENDFNSSLSVVPTYYKYLNIPHCIVIEDYITLFFPHIHNGSNYQFDYKNFEFLNEYSQAFQSDNFRGVICHMKQTLESIDKMFGYNEKISKKLFYLPLAYDNSIEKIKTTNPEKIVFTFTNSFGGQKNNFPLRGGLESLMVFKELYESGYKNIYLNLIGELNIDPQLLNWMTECDNVKIHEPNTTRHGRLMMTEESIHDVLLDTDIFLIPACRIHSMSVVRALCYGNIVLGSNGWGFNEFLDEEFCCAGQENSSYIEDGVLKEKYSLFLEQPNDKLFLSLKNKVVDLIDDHVKMDKIKNTNLRQSKEKFSKKKRDLILEEILSSMTKGI